MKRAIFKNREFIPCTAIAASIGDTERQKAVYVHHINDYFRKGDFIVFGGDLPETEEEAESVLSDPSVQSIDSADLETVEIA